MIQEEKTTTTKKTTTKNKTKNKTTNKGFFTALSINRYSPDLNGVFN
jgi:hypothetical protein